MAGTEHKPEGLVRGWSGSSCCSCGRDCRWLLPVGELLLGISARPALLRILRLSPLQWTNLFTLLEDGIKALNRKPQAQQVRSVREGEPFFAARSSFRDLPVMRDFVGLGFQFRSRSISILGEDYEEATCPTSSRAQACNGPRRSGVMECLRHRLGIHLAECSV